MANCFDRLMRFLRKRSRRSRKVEGRTLTEGRACEFHLINTLTADFRPICSLEHGTTDTELSDETSTTPDTSVATKTTQARTTTRTQPMGEASLKALKTILETIREQADSLLSNFKNQKKSVRCGGNAKIVGTLNGSLGRFRWKRPSDVPGAKAFRFQCLA